MVSYYHSHLSGAWINKSKEGAETAAMWLVLDLILWQKYGSSSLRLPTCCNYSQILWNE